MWIKLTKADKLPVLINLSKVSAATPGSNGGTTFEFDERYTGAPKRITVIESIPVVAELLGIQSSTNARSRIRATRHLPTLT